MSQSVSPEKFWTTKNILKKNWTIFSLRRDFEEEGKNRILKMRMQHQVGETSATPLLLKNKRFRRRHVKKTTAQGGHDGW
jgi:hypothetical protein